MKRAAQPNLSVDGQQALDQYAHALQNVEDLSAVTVRTYLRDLRQFMAWCEDYWRNEQDEQSFTLQAIAPPLLICYRIYLQTTLWLKPSSVNRALMSLKRHFAWATKMQVIQHNPTSTITRSSHHHAPTDTVPGKAQKTRHLPPYCSNCISGPLQSN